MTDEKTAADFGAEGGKKRAKLLPKSVRSEIASRAAESRWAAQGKLRYPKATHEGTLNIGDLSIPCFVLEDQTRLMSRAGFVEAIGRKGKVKGGRQYEGEFGESRIPVFVAAANLKEFISNELIENSQPILFRPLRIPGTAMGFRAELIPQVCNVFMDAKEAGKLRPNQLHIAERCKLLSRAFAVHGIRALIDEATGYQADKAREDALKILEHYIAPTLMPWTRRFPHEFFKEAYRLLGWEYKPGSIKHPSYMGKFINKYVYDALPPGVVDELKRRLPKNENGNRRAKLWQQLTVDTGIPHLDRQILADLTIMQLSDTKEDFERGFQKLFGRQVLLPLEPLKALPSGKGKK